ncbi:MAG: hypothetical protein WKG01_17970 [Kofleriaceae bacterium]
MGRLFVLVVFSVVIAACGKVRDNNALDGGCEPGTALSCDGDNLVVCSAAGEPELTACENGCQPDALVCKCGAAEATCANNMEQVCSADGIPSMRACELGCFDATRCAEIDPTNQLSQFVDDAVTAAELVLNAGDAINTTDGSYTFGGLSMTLPSFELQAPAGGIQVRVFPLKSFTVTGEITVTGFHALAIVSAGDIKIEGIIRQRAGNGPDGNGGGGGFVLCGTGMARIGGQGGGGFAAAGGVGGVATDAAGGTAGPAVGNRDLVPLRGGGNNAGVSQGGGAIQLVSRTRIEVVNGGGIDAGGLGGQSNNGGGGAGGGIVLEAPTVVVAGAGSVLAANGGGGGCGNNGDVITPAENGRLDDVRAAGCQATLADGGPGGAGATPAGGAGQSLAGCGVSAAAGGGAVGRIRISTSSGTFAPGVGGTVTPAPAVSQLGTK